MADSYGTWLLILILALLYTQEKYVAAKVALTIVLFLVLGFSFTAAYAQVYKCGNTYSDVNCGGTIIPVQPDVNIMQSIAVDWSAPTLPYYGLQQVSGTQAVTLSTPLIPPYFPRHVRNPVVSVNGLRVWPGVMSDKR